MESSRYTVLGKKNFFPIDCEHNGIMLHVLMLFVKKRVVVSYLCPIRVKI